MEECQDTSLREKFISVVEPVVISGDEKNITTLLSSLLNACRSEPGVIVAQTKGTSNDKNSSAFTCWLMSQLVGIVNSSKVHEAVNDLLVNIFELLGRNNHQLFSSVMKDFLQIGKAASTILLDGGTLDHKCFSIACKSITESSSLQPKVLVLKDENIANIIKKVVEVIGRISTQLCLFGHSHINEAWLLVGLALDAGDMEVKSTALKAINSMLITCRLPLIVESQDYVAQLIVSCIGIIHEKDYGGKMNENYQNPFEDNLSQVICSLGEQLHNVNSYLALDIMNSFEMFFTSPNCLCKFSGSTLLSSLLQFIFKMLQQYPNKLQSRQTRDALERAVTSSLTVKEVIGICLLYFIMQELEEELPKSKPTDGRPRKRKLEDSEGELTVVAAPSLSIWWDRGEGVMHKAALALKTQTDFDDECIRNCDILINYLNLASELLASVSTTPHSIRVSYLPESLLKEITDGIFSTLSYSNSLEKVLKFLSLLKHLAFVSICSAVNHRSNSEIYQLHQHWVTIASLPWLKTEVEWMDLNQSSAKKVAAIASKAPWSNEFSLKSACLPVLALALGSVSPLWRVKMLKFTLDEGNVEVLPCLMEWFAMFVHNLLSPTSLSFFIEAFGKCLHFSDVESVKLIAKSLKILVCAFSNQSYLKPVKDLPCSWSSLSCTVCHDGSSSKNFVDNDLTKRYLSLAHNSSSEVVLCLIDALPSLLNHSTVTMEMFKDVLDIFISEDDDVIDALCRTLPLFLEPKDLSDLEEGSALTGTRQSYLFTFLQSLTSPVVGDKKLVVKQRTALKILHHLAKIRLLPTNEASLVLLLMCLLSTDWEVAAHAEVLVSDWSKQWHINPKQLYLKNRRCTAQILSKCLTEGYIVTSLSKVSHVFCWFGSNSERPCNDSHSYKSFANSELAYLLPPLIVRVFHEGNPCILQELAVSVGSRLRDMIIDHFQHILAYLVFNFDNADKLRILEFISSTTDIQIENIRKCSVQNQVNELIMGLYDHKDAVLREFLAMEGLERGGSSLGGSDPTKAVRRFLAPRLLGILGFLDSMLVAAPTSYREKQTALLSLSDLLLLMGSEHISPVARKVLATLKTILKIKNFKLVHCKAWMSFLQSLDENTLEGLLEEVILIVMPLVKDQPEEMAPILSKLFVENKSVKPLLKNLPLLPHHPRLQHINDLIKSEQWPLECDTVERLTEVLQFILKGLNQESNDLRLHYLKKLKQVLIHNQQNTLALSLDSDIAHPTVSGIYETLLGMCRESDELHILIAQSFGLFGAIDHSRISSRKFKETLYELYSDIEEEKFVHDIVIEVAKAVMSASDTQTQTCALYAMQEILRMYQIEAKTGNKKTIGTTVYESLPQNVQEILLPLHSSKYTITSKLHPTSLPSPLYGTKYSQTFNSWLSNWVCSLTELLVQERSKKLFSALRPILRRDTTKALTMLSPLLICVLTESSDNQASVVTEILAVISDETIQKSTPIDESSSRSKSNPQSSRKLQYLAVQTIFKSLDYIVTWMNNLKKKQMTPCKSRGVGTFSSSVEIQRVLDFLDKIPCDVVARISFKFHAFSRALRSVESYLKANPSEMKANLSFLQSIYIAIDEPDGVAGVAAIRQDEPTLHEQIIEHEAAGCFQDALGCCERLCCEQGSEDSYKGMLKFYLSLDQPQSVLNITQGLVSRDPRFAAGLHEYQVEAAWRLGNWNELELFLKPEMPPSWGAGVGKILLAARDGDADAYSRALRDLRMQQITPISAASMETGAFQTAYPYILRLQILHELDEILGDLLNISDPHHANCHAGKSSKPFLTFEEMNARWEKRFLVVQPSHRFLEPLLSFRRTLLRIATDWSKSTNPDLSKSLSSQLEKTWLQSAKVVRKAGLVQQGDWAFFGAGQGRDVFVERSKWYWMKGEQHRAVTTLKRGIDKFFPDLSFLKSENGNLDDKVSFARAKLLLAIYSEESATLDVNTIKKLYRDVCEVNKKWEDGHFHLAMYYDRLLSSLDIREKPAEWLLHIVQSFGKSLTYGCKHLHQSMPRLLSIWLDFGAKVVEMGSQPKIADIYPTYIEKLKDMNTYLVQLLERIPYYMFLIALPQLISRICHSSRDVFEVLQLILAKMLCQYPQQAMWHMVQVSKSSYEMRRVRCHQVFESAKRLNPSLAVFFADATKLADLFIELSNKHVNKGITSLTLSSILRSLPRTLSDPKFSNILLPLQSQMIVTLPSSYESTDLCNLLKHQPFSRNEVYLAGIEETVEVMQSLIQPKKITLRGSDGNLYIMMCKPKDDMRKDCRLMEFNFFVNRLLSRDPETRKRNLKIRTYMVVPLNEECGLLEWIPNLCTLRNVIVNLYRDAGMYTSGNDLKRLMCKITDSLETKRNVFLNQLLTKHPPIFEKWFLSTFSDPQSWLRARLAYCRTTAVMSMVGYVLGLGDRHGENILFDSVSGDTVHVDFNCLFNKGETFDWPEKVPFRLTHNMVDAMGPTGYEGVFRKTSEVTLRVMRKEREELMSVLKPFIHDPLVEWEKADKNAKKASGEINNVKAQKHVRDIEERLSGQIHKGRGVRLPLSVEGQVNELIEEATNVDNLCQMYLGWAPYM